MLPVPFDCLVAVPFLNSRLFYPYPLQILIKVKIAPLLCDFHLVRVPKLREGWPDIVLVHAEKADVLLGTGLAYESTKRDVYMGRLLFLTVYTVGIELVFAYQLD